jgi:Domain of unknown function (DUF4476)
MKLFFTLITVFSIFISNAQTAATGSVTIFSEDGDKFTLILNGEIINDVPQSNLRVEDLNQPYYSAKIKFENQTLIDVSINNLMVTDYDRVFSDVTYKIKRDKNNKTKMKMNYFSSVPVNPRYVPASNVQVIHYGQPREVVVIQDKSPVRGSGTTTTTTTTQTGGTNVGVGINIGGINMGVSINENNGGGAVTQTTTTTTSASSTYSNNTNFESNNQNDNSRGCGRKSCMSPNNFNAALATVKKLTFEDSALKTAKQIISSNCLNVDQIIQIANIFNFEENKLDFAKYAYDFCIEPRNYFKLNGIFNFTTNADELSDYVQNRQ